MLQFEHVYIESILDVKKDIKNTQLEIVKNSNFKLVNLY